jgi:hypothetical protein
MRKPISPAPSDAQAKTAGKGIGQYTGAQDQQEQNAEAKRILDMLMNIPFDWMSEWEIKFVNDLRQGLNRPITGKMLFKLRDIKDKYL